MPPCGVLRAHAGACGRVHFALALFGFWFAFVFGLAFLCRTHIYFVSGPVPFVSGINAKRLAVFTRVKFLLNQLREVPLVVVK